MTGLHSVVAIGLVVFLAAIGLLVWTAAGAHGLIGLFFLLQVRPETWSVGGVLFDSFDVVIACIALSVAWRGIPARVSVYRSIPHLTVWLTLAALLSAAYAVSPNGQPHMTDPARIIYQLYRYGVRFALMYPIACLLLNTPKKFDHVLTCIVLAADVFAFMSLEQGYTQRFATGPFDTKNTLGAALAVPTVVAFANILSGRQPLFSLLSALLLMRGALFASSRGAFAGMLAGTAIAWLYMHHARVRTRMGGLVAAGVVALVLALLVKPDLFQRPTVARFLTVADAGQGTLTWRLEERWPHFLRRAWEQPWLGWGTGVDETLGPTANTPHNGYLSLAVGSGFPALGIFLFFAAAAMRDAWRWSARAPDPEDRARAALIGGAVTCIMVHNLVDAVILIPFVTVEFWILAAVAATFASRVSSAAAAATSSTSRRLDLALRTS